MFLRQQSIPQQQYFNPELVQGSAEEAFARYYAPIAQQRQEELEGSMANRGLMRSGNFDGDIRVRLVSHKDYKEELGEEYDVRSCYFNLYKEANNFRRNKCTNSK